MITRTEGDDWIVLQSQDHGYGIAPGAVFQWADSFCSEMVKGNGPRITPRSEVVSAYAAVLTGRQVQIKAYIGQPLVGADGGLFGTLCAIHPSPQPESIVDEQELVELLAPMLSIILQAELSAAEEVPRSERLQAEALTDALTDALTHMYNRRGWDGLLATEEDLCRGMVIQ
jgi:diguanylate cyclase